MFKRIISIITMLCIITGFTGCGGKKEKTDDFSMTKAISYEEKEIISALGIKRPGMRLEQDSKEQLLINDSREKEAYLVLFDSNYKRVYEYNNNSDEGYSTIFTLDLQDNLYLVKEKYSPMKEGDKSREIEYTICILNAKGEKQKSFSIGKRTYTNEQPGISDIAVDSKGKIYVIERRDHIEVYGSDGKRFKDIKAERPDFIEIDKENNLFIGSMEGSSVEKVDAEKAERIWIKKLAPGNFLQGLKFSIKNKQLYIRTDRRILSCSPDGAMNGYIFDLKNSSLLDSNIYIGDFVLDNNKAIYILASNIDRSSKDYKSTPLLYKYTPSKNQQKPEKQKTLNIALGYSEKYIEAAIGKFKKDNPDIAVEVKDYSIAVTSTSADGPGEDEVARAKKAGEDFQKAINTQLMANDGPDIIEVSQLPFEKYADENVLEDIGEMIKNDSAFNMGDYLDNIINACNYKEKLYIMPMNFSFSKFGVNKNIKEKEGLKIDSATWNWKDFVDIAKKISKDINGDGKLDQFALPNFTNKEIYSLIFGNEYQKFIDLEGRTAKFDSKEFIYMLKFAKEVAKEKVFSSVDSSGLYKYKDTGTIAFNNYYFGNYQSIVMAQGLSNGDVEYLELPAFSGNDSLKSFYPNRAFAINNKSKLKKEAWEFIKYLLSEEIQESRDMYAFPINKKALRNKANMEIAENYMYTSFEREGRKVKPLTQEGVDLVNKMIAELQVFNYVDPQSYIIVDEGVSDFFAGKISAEAAAKQIQEKIILYLNE